MSSKVYWYLIGYFVFSRVMMSDWGGWLDALASVVWIAGTIYLAYNMEWRAYKIALRTEEFEEKGEDGKVRTGVRLVHRDRDVVADVGFWLAWLGFLFVLDVLNITIAAMLVIVSFVVVMIVGTFAREIWDVVTPELVRMYKKMDKAVQRFFR